METKTQSPFWWIKKPNHTTEDEENHNNNLTIPKLDLEISSSLADFLEKEQNLLSNRDEHTDKDVGSIIEEINRVAAQSPLGPYKQLQTGDRSIEDIMKEAERVYIESSKSFEQLSQRSKTSQNITDFDSSNATPTPKSISPLSLDDNNMDAKDDGDLKTYSEDFSSEIHSNPSPKQDEEVPPPKEEKEEEDKLTEQLIRTLEDDNKKLREDVKVIKAELQETRNLLEQTKSLSPKISPTTNTQQLEEQLKDAQEANTALQLQLDTITKTHGLLKHSYEDLLSSYKTLEQRVSEFDATLNKYQNDLLEVQSQRDKLQEVEIDLNRIVEVEKSHSKILKAQNEKDARCIQDLNRQIKEMERIIARKHPDSVSALIVAAKNDASDSNLTARKILEDRIKTLEDEASKRDTQSSRIFLDIHEKFNQMKLKYESHIDDLELHVSDLKGQLKRKVDTYDIYTQTTLDLVQKPQKDTLTQSTQTRLEPKSAASNGKHKDDSHLLATIRGLQVDLTNKEKVIVKTQKELDELKKTNRKLLLRDREGSLKNLKEFRSYPEKLSQQSHESSVEDIKILKSDKDRMTQQLCRMEEDYQALKAKRLHDLNVLQEAHEREVATYLENIPPLRQQIELQQETVATLERQLKSAKEELLIVTLERDHLNGRLHSSSGGDEEVEALHKKIAFLEKRYEEREFRLRSIVHGLATRNLTNRGCEQCAERQRQLIGYKAELDQLLATLRTLK